MSALEHIRKRPALVISILGLALVLFIITAVSDNIFSFFGDRDTAVKVDGEKLKYDLWKRSASQISDQMRQSGRDDVDFSYADEMALQQIVDEELFNNELKALGITVTDEEMQGYLFGSGSIASMEAQRYGFPSAEDFYSYAYSNESGSETARALWDDMENRIRRQLMNAKFQLQLGAITANKLDAKAYYDENKNVTLNVAKVDYASLPNEGFDVTDAEIKDLYNKEKETYRLDNEVRLVDYILVTPPRRLRMQALQVTKLSTPCRASRPLPALRLLPATMHLRHRCTPVAQLHSPHRSAMPSTALLPTLS